MRRFIAGMVCALNMGVAQAAIHEEETHYQIDGQTFVAYLAYDDAVSGKRPGVLVVHEWWGHNAYARRRAKMLAAKGYTALALDMYGEGRQAHHPETAGQLSGALRADLDLAKKRFMAATALLKRHSSVDEHRVAAIGYCFGGTVVLNMARAGVDLRGVVSFHGGLSTPRPAQRGEVRAKVLVINGADDPSVSAAEIAEFKREMERAQVDYRFVNYAGAKHSFTVPEADEYGRKFNLPFAYHAQADSESWAELRTFLTKIFAPLAGR